MLVPYYPSCPWVYRDHVTTTAAANQGALPVHGATFFLHHFVQSNNCRIGL
jgi:hypothetical protein